MSVVAGRVVGRTEHEEEERPDQVVLALQYRFQGEAEWSSIRLHVDVPGTAPGISEIMWLEVKAG